MANTGETYYQAKRSQRALDLMQHKNAYVLLSLVAFRARRTDSTNIEGLEPGEALIGDHATCGLTRQEYRTALGFLKRCKFLTTRATNKGTVAKLIDTTVFDINIPSKQPPTQPSSNHQATTNKNVKNEKGTIHTLEKEYTGTLEGTDAFAAHYGDISEDSVEYRTAQSFWEIVKPYSATQADPDFKAWAVPIKRMLDLKGIDPDHLIETLAWAFHFRAKDGFTWAGKVLKPLDFEKHIDRISADMKALRENKPEGGPDKSMEDLVARVVAREEARDSGEHHQ